MHNYIYLLLFLSFISCKPDQNKAEIQSEQPKNEIVSEPETILEKSSETTETTDIKEQKIDEEKEKVTSNKADYIKTETKPEKRVSKGEPIKKEPTKPVAPAKVSEIYVANNIHEFGRITEGDVVKHTFVFENRGSGDLQIKDVLVDCGCTVPEFPKDKIAPGKSGEVAVTFDSKGKIGSQERFITILTNGEPRSKIVKLKGIVDTE